MQLSTFRFPRLCAFKLFFCAVLISTTITEATATATIDTTFGTNGRTAITLGEAQRVGGTAIQPDDKIVVVGDALSGATAQRDGIIVRYNANGTLDQSFGSGGKVTLAITPRDDSFYAVAVQTDGKIVVVGSVSPTTGSTNTDFLIVRLNPNGTLDAGFGDGGIITANQGSQDSLRVIKIQPDGKIVAAGGTSDEGGRGVVFRLNPNGTYDSAFGGGIVFINHPISSYLNEIFYSLDFYSDNRILLGGEITSGNGPGSRLGAVMLLNPNGTIVQNFGNNGFVQTELPNSNLRTLVKVLPNGNFVAGSWSASRYTSEGIFIASIAARYISDIDFLLNGNYVVLSQTSSYPNSNGIFVTNRNFRLVGNDEREDTGTSPFSGIKLLVQSNDKIIIFRGGELICLNGVTSNATRLFAGADKKSDLAVYRPTNRALYILRSDSNLPLALQANTDVTRIIYERFGGSFSYTFVYWQAGTQNGAPGYFRGVNPTGGSAAFQWGASGDVPVGGDYDGDNITDLTVFRPSNGVWYIFQSSNNQARAVQFGQAGDRLVPADYDYDGITDVAVFRPSNGTWYVRRSSDDGVRAVQFGANGDVPTAGDYDGDGRADFTVFRPSNGVWYSLKSLEGFSAVQFGAAADQPVPGDYDGDGRHDAAVFRQGIWYLNQSRDGLRALQWGLPDDVPVSIRY